MSDEKEEEIQKPSDEVSDPDLDKVTGGAVNTFVNYGEIKGEAYDKDNKDWIEMAKLGQQVKP